MPAAKLVLPTSEVKESYLQALKEYHAERSFSSHEYKSISENFDDFIEKIRDPEFFFGGKRQDWMEPVPETVLWMVKDGLYIGTVIIRHRLNWHLEKWGGNIFFSIRPSMRKQGFGKKILQKAIPFISYIGMDKALLTVAPENKAAIRIIEFAGAEFEDETPETEKFPSRMRYWINCT